MKYYNDTTIKIKARDTEVLVLKAQGMAPVTYEAADDYYEIDATGFTPGVYYLQFMLDGEVIETDRITVEQNLATAAEDFDPRSENEKILEAIEAMLAGRATTQQRSISIDGQAIQYSSFSELLEWKNYYTKKVAMERGHKRVEAQRFKLKRF